LAALASFLSSFWSIFFWPNAMWKQLVGAWFIQVLQLLSLRQPRPRGE
jgi:hypothetical protein